MAPVVAVEPVGYTAFFAAAGDAVVEVVLVDGHYCDLDLGGRGRGPEDRDLTADWSAPQH